MATRRAGAAAGRGGRGRQRIASFAAEAYAEDLRLARMLGWATVLVLAVLVVVLAAARHTLAAMRTSPAQALRD